MRKILNNPKVVAVLALGAAGAVGFTVWSETRPTTYARVTPAAAAGAGYPEADSTAGAAGDAAAPLDRDWAALTALLQKPARDPFVLRRPVVQDVSAAAEDLPDLEEAVLVSAIWTQAGRSLALVNGRIQAEGDRVGRVSISRITRDGVHVSHWRGEDLLTVGQPFVLKTPARLLAATP